MWKIYAEITYTGYVVNKKRGGEPPPFLLKRYYFSPDFFVTALRYKKTSAAITAANAPAVAIIKPQ